MNALQRIALCTALLGFITVGAYAQVITINSDVIHARVFNDIPSATLTTVNNYPSAINFSEVGVSAPTGFANRDVWNFSADGANNYLFANNDYFVVSMELTLTGDPISPRKEAGFILSSVIGDGQFIVNTDAHEIVAFGGPFPFYAFPATFNSGDKIKLAITYFQDAGNPKIIYSANGVNSPALPFSNIENGIADGSILGGYLQIVNDPSDSSNSGSALFENIVIEPFQPNQSVPEPSTFLLVGAGLAGLAYLRRRK